MFGVGVSGLPLPSRRAPAPASAARPRATFRPSLSGRQSRARAARPLRGTGPRPPLGPGGSAAGGWSGEEGRGSGSLGGPLGQSSIGIFRAPYLGPPHYELILPCGARDGPDRTCKRTRVRAGGGSIWPPTPNQPTKIIPTKTSKIC